MLRSLLADNPSELTLDGTRTWIVGARRAAIIDPGPDLPSHIDAVVREVFSAGDGVVASILLTHHHPDHAGGARMLAVRLGCEIVELHDGRTLPTDAGDLVALATPGHTPDHFALHWPSQRAIFCGDLMMGGLDTALVARPEGNLADYLASLERLRALAPRVIHPAHGPSFEDAEAALDRYTAHRLERLEQVRQAMHQGAKTPSAIVDAVYGPELTGRLRDAAEGAVAAYVEYLRAREGRSA